MVQTGDTVVGNFLGGTNTRVHALSSVGMLDRKDTVWCHELNSGDAETSLNVDMDNITRRKPSASLRCRLGNVGTSKQVSSDMGDERCIRE
jgi:hypothetical protein